jgi:hypothetical protein
LAPTGNTTDVCEYRVQEKLAVSILTDYPEDGGNRSSAMMIAI